MAGPAVVFALLVLAFAASARGLSRYYVTAPIAFVTVGAVISAVGPPLDVESVLQLRMVAEVTLALILFADAAHVRPRQLGADAGLVARMLLVALPLSVLLGFLGARVAFPQIPVMAALLLAAALAPTDAGLSAPTVLNPVVPVRVRRLLNVEGGLNDGLVTPVVLFAIAAIGGSDGQVTALGALTDVAGGIAAGIAAGVGGGLLLGWSRQHDLSTAQTRALGVLGIPILAFFLAEAVDTNGFVAAFVAGTAFAGSASWSEQDGEAMSVTESLSELLGFAVWLVFGLAAAPAIAANLGWREALYALASLTLFRMLPVAAALVGTGFRLPTVAFIGWFGPRGLATIVFALIALENLEQTDTGRRVLAAAAFTVLLSVLAHGLTAEVLAARYGAWFDRTRPDAESRTPAAEPRTRTSFLRGRKA
ncbi:MAG TPA: cation:proton antiporter [Actinotalea sp.]|nr:cation:proton antiporter [Actinotalea sp.]